MPLELEALQLREVQELFLDLEARELEKVLETLQPVPESTPPDTTLVRSKHSAKPNTEPNKDILFSGSIKRIS